MDEGNGLSHRYKLLKYHFIVLQATSNRAFDGCKVTANKIIVEELYLLAHTAM
jgi:hypothetical protein